MAIRSLFTQLQQQTFRGIGYSGAAKGFYFLRGISSNTLCASTFHDLSHYNDSYDTDLKSKLLFLAYPKKSATKVLQNWVGDGRKVSIYDLRDVSQQLVKRRRYKHALEVMKWMEGQQRFQLSEADYALRLELTIKASTLKEAEDYFAQLPNIASQKASYLHLLNSYVQERATEKAESLMIKMSSFGANVTPHSYNAMMKLYMATSQFDLVLSIISQMKTNKIPKNVLSYNLWMSACHEVYGVKQADMVYKEMVNDPNVKVGWSSLCTLANIYMKSGLSEKAAFVLRDAEAKLSTYNHFGYFFLITNYASLKDREGVIRVWEASKQVDGKLTCANYMCMMSCLVKLGDVKEAEKIFLEWELQCRKYDIRVSNILLGAYVRDNLMEKAEALHYQTLEKGGCPNYKTWEILMEGYLRNQNMENAVFAMKHAFKLLKRCDWRPSPMIIGSIFEYFEKSGNLEDGNWFLKVLRDFNPASLGVYRSLIRMHVAKGKPFGEIVKLMEKDKIDMDDEIINLVQASQTGALSYILKRKQEIQGAKSL
uniref:pentatricopeptide repeat-containing protein At5g27460 n=1 Tax=Erigeron canadensis TaxID=72917 RepID=UPI001CB9BB8D|nr:pentatricopeptide repeat-containing protein At5g27460 [Erigeron canadensis]XP_043636808.1 pentatricopeptide repeat-containing protein At5g27460 [Erigeron canadensis]